MGRLHREGFASATILLGSAHPQWVARPPVAAPLINGVTTMPGKSRSADKAAVVSDDAIRQRAYYLWEADGRPEGRGDHYWALAHAEAHAEAHRAMVEDTATRTARITKGKNPLEMPAEVKAGQKAGKAKVKAAENKTKPAKKAKPFETKPAKKAPKPRAAVKKVP